MLQSGKGYAAQVEHIKLRLLLELFCSALEPSRDGLKALIQPRPEEPPHEPRARPCHHLPCLVQCLPVLYRTQRLPPLCAEKPPRHEVHPCNTVRVGVDCADALQRARSGLMRGIGRGGDVHLHEEVHPFTRRLIWKRLGRRVDDGHGVAGRGRDQRRTRDRSVKRTQTCSCTTRTD